MQNTITTDTFSMKIWLFLIGSSKVHINVLRAHIFVKLFEWYHTWWCWQEYCRVIIFVSKYVQISVYCNQLLFYWVTLLNFDGPLKEPHLMMLGHSQLLDTFDTLSECWRGKSKLLITQNHASTWLKVHFVILRFLCFYDINLVQ